MSGHKAWLCPRCSKRVQGWLDDQTYVVPTGHIVLQQHGCDKMQSDCPVCGAEQTEDFTKEVLVYDLREFVKEFGTEFGGKKLKVFPAETPKKRARRK